MAAGFVRARGIPMFALADLVPDAPGNKIVLNGVAGAKATPLGWCYLYLEDVDGVAGFHDWVIALVMEDDSSFAGRVPLLLGTCTLDLLMQVTKESELESLPGPVKRVKAALEAARTLTQMRLTVDDPTTVTNKKTDATKINEKVKLRADCTILPGEIKETRGLTPLMFQTHRANVLVERAEVDHLPKGVIVMNTFSTVPQGSKAVAVAISNFTDRPVHLKKGTPIGRMSLACPAQKRAMAAGVILEAEEKMQGHVPARPCKTTEGTESGEPPSDSSTEWEDAESPAGIIDARREESSGGEESCPRRVSDTRPKSVAETTPRGDDSMMGDTEVKTTDTPAPPPREKLTVEERQAKLLGEMDLTAIQKHGRDFVEAVQRVLISFHDVFSLDAFELGSTKAAEHKIQLSDHTPFKERFRRIPLPLVEEVRAHIKEMLDAGVIVPSKSPWSSAVVLVRKKDGSLRFCIDYRKLNARTIRDSYALPRVDETLDALQGSRYFSSLDLKSGFWQIPMAGESRQKTAFTVANLGFFEWLYMPFGLTNAPATFQRVMEECLGDMHLAECLIYLDDVIIYSQTPEDHLRRLTKAFERLRKFELKLKPSKCELFKEELTYVGHRVTKEGISPDPHLVDSVLEMKVPVTFTEIRQFLGMAGYYRRFIKDYSKKAGPLNAFLKGENSKKKTEAVTLDEEAVRAFELLKRELTQAPVLGLPDFTGPEFLLETDASGYGLGAVLSQKGADGKYHPIGYGSRVLKPAEVRYHAGKLEFLALFWAVTKHFAGHLLHVKEFQVRTDNNPLTYVLTSAKLDAAGHRWVNDLLKFNFNLSYQKGTANVVADALSRYRCHMTAEEVREALAGVLTSAAGRAEALTEELVRQLLNEDGEAEIISQAIRPKLRMHVVDWAASQGEDEELAAVVSWMKKYYGKDSGDLGDQRAGNKWSTRRGREAFAISFNDVGDKSMQREWSANRFDFRLRQGVLYKVYQPPGEVDQLECYVVPRSQRQTVMDGCHTTAGHQGKERTLSLLRERFWWPSMRRDVNVKLEACMQCKRHKARPEIDKLRPIVVTAPLELVHIDFTSAENTMDLKAQPKSHNILVVQDHFTKYAMAHVTPDQKATTVARYLWESFFSVFGPPARLISDRGANFESAIIAELCKLLNVEKVRTTAYHAQGNGQVERFHQTLFKMIGTLHEEEKEDWPRQLKALTFAYNSTRSAVTGYSPYFLMFGMRPRIPIDFILPTQRLDGVKTKAKTTNHYVATLQARLKSAFTEARLQSMKEAERQKVVYDRRSGSSVLQKGDTVLLRLDAARGKRKLKDRWGSDLLEVQGRVDDDTPLYRVKFPDGKIATIHRNRMLFIPRGAPGAPLVLAKAGVELTAPGPRDTESLGKNSDESGSPKEETEPPHAQEGSVEDKSHWIRGPMRWLSRTVERWSSRWLSNEACKKMPSGHQGQGSGQNRDCLAGDGVT